MEEPHDHQKGMLPLWVYIYNVSADVCVRMCMRMCVCNSCTIVRSGIHITALSVLIYNTEETHTTADLYPSTIMQLLHIGLHTNGLPWLLMMSSCTLVLIPFASE